MYDATDPVENLRQTREVAALLRAAVMDPYEAHTLALLGGLPGSDGGALRSAAQGMPLGAVPAFGPLRQLALPGGGQRLVGSPLAVEEVYARMAVLGYDPSPQPVAFHCLEEGCEARAQLMIDELLRLGISPDRIRRVWAFSERAFDGRASRMRPTGEDGLPFLEYNGAVIEFDYHVAPAVIVEEADGSQVLRVFDPSLVNHPVPVAVWHRRVGTPIQFPLTAQTTELGLAPIDPRTGVPFPGSGYWPGSDPRGATASDYAEDVMDQIMTANAALGRPPRPLPQL
jgi:hypothetical protein